MRTRSVPSKEMAAVEIRRFEEGDPPNPATEQEAADRITGKVIYVVYPPPFIEKEELADDIVDSHGQWSSFQHYTRSASVKTFVLASNRTASAYYANGTREWWGRAKGPALLLWNSSVFGSPDYPVLGLGSMYEVRDGQLFILPPPDLGPLLGGAVKRLLRGAKEELSLLNSLYELKDIRTLSNTAKRVREGMGVIGDFLRGRRLPARSLRSLRRMTADLYLQWRFNIRPFVSDLVGLTEALKRFSAQSNQLVREAAKIRTRHIAFALPSGSQDDDTALDPVVWPDGDYGAWERNVHRRMSSSSKFHVEMQISYFLSAFQQQHAAGLTLLDKFGINLDPSIVWNALPWTFTIDWVLGISEYLDRLKDSNMGSVVVIHRCLWSVVHKRDFNLSLDYGIQAGIPVSSVQEVGYSRNLFIPTADWIQSSGLSPGEWSLIAALASSRR